MSRIISLLTATFANNSLSIIITTAVITVVSGMVGLNYYSEWSDNNKKVKQQKAIVEKHMSDRQVIREIKEKADETTNSNDNSFLRN